MEDVNEYPDSPRAEACKRRARVELAGKTIANSPRAVRVLQRGSPPTIYIPKEDVRMEFLRRVDPSAGGGSSACPYKGTATYWDVVVEGTEARRQRAAWSYEEPKAAFAAIRGSLAFYADKMGACYLDEERVTGDPSGGWITKDIKTA